VYDWYDVDVVLAALPALLGRDRRTTLVFIQHPHPDLTPQSAAGRARAEAERRGWLGREVRFEAWRPAERRFDLARVADLAVVTHVPGLETDLSLRTRLVDLLWLGLPVVVTSGGTMSRVVREEGCGVVVPPGDAAALAGAVSSLLDDVDRRVAMAVRGRQWAARRTWPEVARPLLEFARRPWRDPHRDRFRPVGVGAVRGADSVGTRLRRRLRRILGAG
jgi:glycosyltransferase involved in cell wall biosynthesis